MNPVILAGRGPSISFVNWGEWDCPIAAVSGGIFTSPHADMLITMDSEQHFPNLADTVEVHTTTSSEWTRDIVQHETCEGAFPEFTDAGMVRNGLLWLHNMRKQVAEPDRPHYGIVNNSMLFAVQVLPRLGFDTIYFAGVDLTQPHLKATRDVLTEWYPKARDAGIEWFNLSPLSYLQGVIPDAERIMQP